MKPFVGPRPSLISALLCGLLCFVATGRAELAKPADAKLNIERVALFKNGLGFITSGITLPENAKAVRIGQLPVPSFGTFWVAYPKDLAVRSLVTSMEEVEGRVSAQDIGNLLQANVGRKVTLRTGPGEKEVVTGTVMASETEMSEPANPYLMDVRRRLDPSHYYAPAPPAGRIALIKTERGIVAVNAASVIRADFEGEAILRSVPTKQKRPSIRMELDRAVRGERASVSYLARGITWAPAYLIDLSDSKTARFCAHALILNELADFKNVKLELVTGFPNIKFGEVASPVAMSQSLADFLNALAGGTTEAGRGRGSMVTQQARLRNVPSWEDASEAPPMPSYSTAAEGLISEDLFLYPLKDFTLMKGETAWIPLFTAEMPYRHIYTWKIGDLLDKDDRYRSESARAEGKVAEEVWHSCRLVNSLKMPLTTAAAEFMKDGQFTGQDVCYYTAPGAETTIRINRAMNVLADEGEFEVERTRNAANFYGYQYDLVRVRGELKLRSKLKESVDVEVTKELSGEVLKKLPAAKDVKTAKGLKQVNPKHVLTWEIKLKPGEEQTLSYEYKVYIRS